MGVWGQGYIRLFRIRSIPVRVHWSVALALLWVSGPSFQPGAWTALIALVLAHECGHAYLARRYRLRVHSIEMDGLGGLCVYDKPRAVWHGYVIAWGGVLAQLVVLIATLTATWTGYWPGGSFFASVAHVFVEANILIMAINLIPVPPLDGASAWKLFKKRKAPRPQDPVPPKQRKPRNLTAEELAKTEEAVDRALEGAKRGR